MVGVNRKRLLCLRVAVATDDYDLFSSCSLRFPNKRSCSLSICQLRALVTVHKKVFQQGITDCVATE